MASTTKLCHYHHCSPKNSSAMATTTTISDFKLCHYYRCSPKIHHYLTLK
ncbi:hypothetical protein NC652_001582 [Populus alba x Populus x berolinensis]|nr:hypothetical protein NC652_001582 [Populus alba x Populus x berolinensis]